MSTVVNIAYYGLKFCEWLRLGDKYQSASQIEAFLPCPQNTLGGIVVPDDVLF